jgi:propanol-preferring alcohol dehydrogenase
MPHTMEAMRIDPDGVLRAARVPLPALGDDDILLRVGACGVCRTDLHILDGDLPAHGRPLIPGHEIVGRVVAAGRHARRFDIGQRVGVPWLGSTCGKCHYCLEGRENLCELARFTGYDRDGGYAQYAAANERYCFALPERYDDAHVAPLLCAGLIGYRAYVAASGAGPLGLYGFGAAAHIITQLAVRLGRTVYAFTRAGDTRSQHFARSLGAAWAGASGDTPPQQLGAAILFAPVGALVPLALAASAKGATIVCAGIHMSDIPAMPYALLWGERSIRSVANLTRKDGEDFFRLAEQHELHTVPVAYPLDAAAAALADLRQGCFDGAAVLLPPHSAGAH